MSETNKSTENKDATGTLERDRAAKKAFTDTRGSYGNKSRASVRAFALGNRWAEENARAVGNW